ncbi:MAG: phosphoesterase [Planctomycetes bacterium]|nr:phosphoesterase [Planctomycetota bacterium]
MTLSPAIANAIALPSGARFFRCAFQVNPPHYAGTYRGSDHGMSEEEYIDALIDKCLAVGVQVLAVTDHNHVGSIDAIRQKAIASGIAVFPGFEAASAEGVHILCVYPPDTSVESLGRYLGQLGIHDTSTQSDLSDKPFCELLETVRKQGGIAIAAHITHNSGLLNQLHGKARINAWKDTNLLVVQIPGEVASVPQDKLQIVRNKNPEYKREPGASDNLALAVINASDVAEPNDLDDPGTTTYIKMCQVTIDGLRQAFLDPASRIRLNSDPVPDQHTEFVAISWLSGFLGDAAIHFNENLNVLIGGRGTGKSTVIESLRYVLGLEPMGPDATKISQGIIKNVLGNGTKVSLLVRSYSPSRREYLIERTIPNPPVVKDEAGNVLNLTPKDIVPGAEVYGQHEISEIAKSPEKRTLLLERFIERDPTLPQKKSDLRLDLERSRLRHLELRRDEKAVEERLATLPALEETLKRFQEASLDDKLKGKSQLVQEERVLTTVKDRVQPFRVITESLSESLPIDRDFLADEEIDELPGKPILDKAGDILERLDIALKVHLDAIEATLQKADEEVAAVLEEWGVRKKEVEEDYSRILRELQQSKIDGTQFIAVKEQIEALRPLREQQSKVRTELRDTADKRKNQLAKWEDLKADEFNRLEKAAKRVSKQLSNRVRVRVAFAGNRDPLVKLLQDSISGRFSEAVTILREKEALSLTELAKACREGKESLVSGFGLSAAQAEKLAEAGPELFMKLEELELSATTSIELNVAAEGDPSEWRALDDLSTGQKATAILLLLLLRADAPLIVDQPEDDLDNRFITEGIVPKMREEKRQRQFIFSTHNANIPVLGDAELIVGMTAAGEASSGQVRIAKEHMGSIDDPNVRRLVEEVLEGGRTAFELRRLKYGF